MATRVVRCRGAPAGLSRVQKRLAPVSLLLVDGSAFILKPHTFVPKNFNGSAGEVLFEIRKLLPDLPKPVKELLNRSTVAVLLHTKEGALVKRELPESLKRKRSLNKAICEAKEFAFRVARQSAATIKALSKINSIKGLKRPNRNIPRWSSWDEDRFFDEFVFGELQNLSATGPDLTTCGGFIYYTRKVVRWFRSNPLKLNERDKSLHLDASINRLVETRELEWELRRSELQDEFKEKLSELRGANLEQRLTLKHQADALLDRIATGVPFIRCSMPKQSCMVSPN